MRGGYLSQKLQALLDLIPFRRPLGSNIVQYEPGFVFQLSPLLAAI